MAKIVKVKNNLNSEEPLFWEIESNASITLQEGKPLSNQTNASLFNTQFLKTTITTNFSKEEWTKEVLDHISPWIYCNLVFAKQDQ